MGRCLIKSLRVASRGKWNAELLDGNTHTFAEVNAYLKIAYDGNAPELVPILVSAFSRNYWGYLIARLFLFLFIRLNPQERLIVEIEQHKKGEINKVESHVICIYRENLKVKFYEPHDNTHYPIRQMKYRNIKGVWVLQHSS